VTKLSSSLPKEIEQNGLLSVNQQLINEPDEGIFVVARIICSKVTKDMSTRAETATAVIVEVEPLSGADADQAEHMLRAANERRVPRPEPIPGLADQMFSEIRKGFHVVDLGTGEIDPEEEGDDD
jgi:hypothetical protein